MRLGLFGINMGSCTSPDGVAAAARAAEAAGFDSVWAGEHVVLPDPRVPPSPMEPDDPGLDPLLALTWAAAVSRTLRLVTGIIILPQRNPVVLAKEIVTVDVLSGGRFTLGIGVGYLEPEFRAIGANFADRGAVADEFLAAMQHLWYDDRPQYDGRFVDFAGVNAYPRPVQKPVPIVVGGRTAAAYRRAVSKANGWYGFALTPDAAKTCIEGLSQAASRVERPASLGELEITITPRGELTAEAAAEFAALGVHRLVPMPPAGAGGVDSTIDSAVAAVARL